MYIGKLNEKLNDLQLHVTKKDLSIVPTLREDGNPLLGQTLNIAWQELLASGADLHIHASGTSMLSAVVLTLGADAAPVSVRLLSADKRRLISSYTAETGKTITEKTIELALDEAIDDFVIEICGDFADTVIEEIALYGAIGEEDALFPTPVSFTKTSDARVSLRNFSRVCADCPDATRAAEILIEKWAEKPGILLTLAQDGGIRFVHDSAIAENGCAVCVTPDMITVSASDLRGFTYGAETLVKLEKDASLPVCEISDAPFQPMRGVHLFLPGEAEMAFARRLIKYLISPMGYNHVILEIGGAMRFDSHPEINEALEEAVAKGRAGIWPAFPHDGVGGGKTVSKQSVRDFVAYIRSFGIDVIPEVQSLGHVQYLTTAHPEIAERPVDAPVYEKTDTRIADIPPRSMYPHCYCPSNPKSYELLFDILDEIIDVIQPCTYVHMGHDEVYQIGVCPVCQHLDPADLFVQDVCRIHDYLAKRNLKMMIWADMLQPDRPYKTVSAISRLPKDITMLDFVWYFYPEKDIEDNLLAHDYTVMIGNLYSSHFPRYETRIRKRGMIGGQISAWVGTNEEDLAREGKLYDFLMTAQLLHSADYTHYALRAYDRLLAAGMPQLREQLEDVRYPSRSAQHTCTTVAQQEDFDPRTAAEGGKFDLDGRYNSLVFEHAATLPQARLPWLALDVIGHYAVSYADGTTLALPVTYAGNISCWNRRANDPFTGMYYRHTGYQAASWYTDGVRTLLPDGTYATLYRWEWINPQPDKAIRSVEWIPAPAAQTAVVIRRITGVR